LSNTEISPISIKLLHYLTGNEYLWFTLDTLHTQQKWPAAFINLNEPCFTTIARETIWKRLINLLISFTSTGLHQYFMIILQSNH